MYDVFFQIIQKLHCENAFILFVSDDQRELYCEVNLYLI